MSLPNYPEPSRPDDDTESASMTDASSWSTTGKLILGAVIAVILATVITLHLTGLVG